MFGFSMLSSFYTVGFDGFDYWFFLITVGYIILSNIAFHFIEKAVLNNSGRSSKAKRFLFQKYEFVDKNNYWSEIITYDTVLDYMVLFCRVINIYSNYCFKYGIKKHHTDEEIRTLAIKGVLINQLKQEKVPYKYRHKIKKFEKEAYNNNYFWDKQYNRFKNGTLLNQNNNSNLYALVSLLLGIGSIATSVLLTINVLPETRQLEKLLFLVILVIADIVYYTISAIHSIDFVERQSKSIIRFIDYLYKENKTGDYCSMVINRFCRCGKNVIFTTGIPTIDDGKKIIETIKPNFVKSRLE